ncbi:hypothetical protein BDY24DRAFT_382543 [Mrakia frigida]|uniref:alpha/beta hydrolase family protein n=1 Tax=Mrakia frigida TaxID=29902 RepID=UPI003FCBF227
MRAQAILSALSLSSVTQLPLSIMDSSATVSRIREALGPFPLGTRELPYVASPLAAFTKGNQTEEELFLGLDFKEGMSEFPSSYAVDGKATWGRFEEDETGWVEVGWEGVDWAQLRRTEGWASLQYLALLRTNLTISGSSPSIPVNLDLTQAHSFAIIPKDRPVKTAVRWHTGDIYAYSDFQASSAGFPSKLAGCVEELEVGEYWLMVRGLYETRMFGDPKESSPKIKFRFGAEAVSSSSVLLGVEDAQIGFPDVVDGWLFGEVAGVALRAGSGKDGVIVRAIEVVEKVEGVSLSIYPFASPLNLLPYQTRPLALSINQTSRLPSNITSLTLRVTLSSLVSTIETTSSQLYITLPLNHRSHWSSNPIFYPALRYTYLDTDLTVQYAMVQPPLLPSDGISSAVVLATHGAGVDTSSPFWTEALGERRTGLGWVVFATGKTPWGYDWHGASAESVFAARKALEKVVVELKVRRNEKEDWGLSDRTFLVGHSNGGQGASYLLERYPDEFLGSISAAGYLKIQSYVAFTQWSSSHFVDPSLWGILLSSLASFDNDIHASNAAHLPFMLVHGREDDNVPVWHSRELKSLVDRWTGNVSSVVLQEIPEQSHWFDGILSSPEARSFLNKQLVLTGPPKDAYLKEGFTLTCANVDENGSKGGWKILELDQPGRLARLQVSPLRDNDDLSTLRLKTTNTRRISFAPSSATNLEFPLATLHIDSTILPLPSHLSTSTDLITLHRPDPSSSWTLLDSSISPTPPPRVSGPIIRILTSEGPLVLVVPSLESRQEVEIAKRIAHDAFVYARLDAEIVSSEVAEKRVLAGGKGLEGSLVVIGGWRNAFGRSLNSTAVSFPALNIFSVATSFGPRTFDPKNSPSTGLLSLHPHPTNGRGLALHLAGTDPAGLERAYRLFPVRTGTPLPDWIVIGPQADWQGAGGIEAAGFFGPDWKYNEGMSWTS